MVDKLDSDDDPRSVDSDGKDPWSLEDLKLLTPRNKKKKRAKSSFKNFQPFWRRIRPSELHALQKEEVFDGYENTCMTHPTETVVTVPTRYSKKKQNYGTMQPYKRPLTVKGIRMQDLS